MLSHPTISKALVETGAYRDLDRPVILTSGQLGIFYINAEKLCPDGGEFEKYGDDPQGMMQHTLKMVDEHPVFEEVINILAGKAFELLRSSRINVVSGGQRRDWIFSGPVANNLGLPHVCINKDGSMKLFTYDGQEEDYELGGVTALHVVDLITEGSSVYSSDGRSGWVPALRENGARVRDLIAVVTRLQGGEERLAQRGVTVHPFVAIDEEFLRTYSSNPDEAVAYLRNPNAWSKNYLREYGALALLSAFDPKGGKLDRAGKFLERYRITLQESGRLQELESAIEGAYGRLDLGE